MSARLPWARGDRTQHFKAKMPEGMAEVWYGQLGNTGSMGWQFRIAIGQTISVGTGSSKQGAADAATLSWPDIARREQVRVKQEAGRAALHAQIEAASGGKLDVMAFGLATSEYDRLLEINDVLRRHSWLDGPLKPLAQAVSAELYRRRTTPRA